MSSDTKYTLSRFGILFGTLIVVILFSLAMSKSASTKQIAKPTTQSYSLLTSKGSIFQKINESYLGFNAVTNTLDSQTNTTCFLNTESGKNYELSNNDQAITTFTPVPENDARHNTITITKSKIIYKAFGNSKNRETFKVIIYANKSDNLKISNKAMTQVQYAYQHNFVNPATGE